MNWNCVEKIEVNYDWIANNRILVRDAISAYTQASVVLSDNTDVLSLLDILNKLSTAIDALAETRLKKWNDEIINLYTQMFANDFFVKSL